jgi:circadian clock protein KaiB
MDKINLTLYVTGQVTRSQRAISNLRKICRLLPPGQCVITIVDVLEQPHLAEQSKIIATPTLVKNQPLPLRRIVGDLSDPDQVISWMGLTEYLIQSD